MADPLNYNVISLQAQADREVEQDMISITFSTTQAGPSSAIVQEALVLFTTEALEIARACRKGSQVRVETGGMSVQPAYDKKGGISGYQGRSSIIVSGTDTKTISELTGKIKSMSVADIDFSISPALTKRVLKKLTLEAIAAFQEKALEVATAFSATSFKLINANVSSGTGHRNRNVRAAAMAFSTASASASMEVEGGKELLQASVNGSIQLT